MTKCSACNAEILFLQTVNGRMVPVNLPPKKMFVELIGPCGSFEGYDVEDCYESHFATCPEAARFRKAKHASQETHDPA